MLRKFEFILHSLFLTSVLAACGGPHMPFSEKAKSTAGIAGGDGSAVTVNFTDDIKPLFQAKCSACHGPGRMHPKDWTDYNTAFGDKELIHLRVVVAKTMPMGAALPDAERELVVAWLNAGAPLNAPVGQSPKEAKPPLAQPVSPPVEQPIAPPNENNPTLPPKTELSFSADIKPLIVKNCSTCHFSGGPFPNIQDYNVAVSLKEKILQKAVIEKSMPPPGVGNISDEERAIIGDWITSGTVE